MRRDEVKTPALILDLDVLDTNISTMVATAREFGVGLRPHAKSHKSPDIARRLVAAGALGACCATIAEAEGLAAAGIPGLGLGLYIANRIVRAHGGHIEVKSQVSDGTTFVVHLPLEASGATEPLL